MAKHRNSRAVPRGLRTHGPVHPVVTTRADGTVLVEDPRPPKNRRATPPTLTHTWGPWRQRAQFDPSLEERRCQDPGCRYSELRTLYQHATTGTWHPTAKQPKRYKRRK